MKILALERELPEASGASDRSLLRQEAQRIWELVQSGALRETYFDAERHTAVLVLECRDAAEAHELLAGLPLVAAGRIDFELHPLVPYDGFARLFETPDGSQPDPG